MLDNDTALAVERFIERFGSDALRERLESVTLESSSATLTIVANEGIHPRGQPHKRGEVFVASRGNLDFSSAATAGRDIREALDRVARKLKERVWKRVYIVPFGPSVLSMQIKALVHHVSHLDSIEVLHAGGGEYFDIQIDLRDVAVGQGASPSPPVQPTGSA